MKALLMACILFGHAHTYIVFATVTHVDEISWTAFCTDESGHVYTFEADDEYNTGDHVRLTVSDNGTLFGHDDYVTEVHY